MFSPSLKPLPFIFYLVAFILAAAIILPEAVASPLERTHISRFHVTAVPGGDVTYLHIRGFPMASSASGCSKLQIKVKGDEVCLRAKLFLFRRGGRFDYIVTIPANIKRVVFGDLQKEIWPKDDGARHYSDAEQQALDKAIAAFKAEKPDLNIDDYFAFVDKELDLPDRKSDHFSILFCQDGPAPSSIRELHRYKVSKTGSVSYIGRSYSGQMLMLEQLGKTDDWAEELKSNEHPNAKVEALQL